MTEDLCHVVFTGLHVDSTHVHTHTRTRMHTYMYTHSFIHTPPPSSPPHTHTHTVLLPKAHGPAALSLSQSPPLLPPQEWHVAQTHPAHPSAGVFLQVRLSGWPDQRDETVTQARHTHIQLLEAQKKSKSNIERQILFVKLRRGGGPWHCKNFLYFLGRYLIPFLMSKFRGIVASIHFPSLFPCSCSPNTISRYCLTCPLRHHWRASEQNLPQLVELGWVEMVVITGS